MECEGHVRAARAVTVTSLPSRQPYAPPTLKKTLVQHGDTNLHQSKFPDCVENEINRNNTKHSLRSNTEGYGGKTH
jgi:hypothetical protein